MNGNPEPYLLKIVYQKKVRVAHFGHWGGSKACVTIANFLRHYRRSSFLARLERVELIEATSPKRDDVIQKAHSTDCVYGVEVLDFIENQNKPRTLRLGDYSFLENNDSFCSWKYTIDFDAEQITVINCGVATAFATFAEFRERSFAETLCESLSLFVDEMRSAPHGIPQRYVDEVAGKKIVKDEDKKGVKDEGDEDKSKKRVRINEDETKNKK